MSRLLNCFFPAMKLTGPHVYRCWCCMYSRLFHATSICVAARCSSALHMYTRSIVSARKVLVVGDSSVLRALDFQIRIPRIVLPLIGYTLHCQPSTITVIPPAISFSSFHLCIVGRNSLCSIALAPALIPYRTIAPATKKGVIGLAIVHLVSQMFRGHDFLTTLVNNKMGRDVPIMPGNFLGMKPGILTG
jgi:hypothetical protein